MSPKRENKPDKPKNNPIHGYLPVFSPDFKADLAWWYRNEPKKGDKILDLLADILDGDPFTGLGRPEPLKYIAADTWSRRIDLVGLRRFRSAKKAQTITGQRVNLDL